MMVPGALLFAEQAWQAHFQPGIQNRGLVGNAPRGVGRPTWDFLLLYKKTQNKSSLEENLAGKLFCGFDLKEQTPEHTYFVDLRQRIGTKRLAELFNRVREALLHDGHIREVFTFVDATKLISKLSTWDERDKTIKAGEEKFNNAVAANYARDKESLFQD